MRLRSDSRGAALLEFALIAPLLIVLLFGIIDFSRYFFTASSLNSATREAARYGSIVGPDEDNPNYADCAGIVTTGQRFEDDFVAAIVNVEYFNDLALVTPVADCDDGDGTYPNPTTFDFTSGDRVTVSASLPFGFVTPFIGDVVGPQTISSSETRTLLSP